MLLAAGRGKRMGALTEHCPKPLLAVAGKPLIVHHIETLRAAGFSEIVINTGYLGEQIRAALGDGSGLGVAISYSIEPQEALETGGGIYQALPLLGNQPFCVINADVWCDYPRQRLRQHILAGWAHLILVDNPPHHPQGDFALTRNGLLHGEAPNDDGGPHHTLADAPRLTFSGISVLHPRLFSDAQPGRYSVVPLLRRAMAQGLVTGERYSGEWRDIGTPERLAALNHAIAAG